MARRPDPERVLTARREAALASMRSAGVPSDRAVAELKKNEQWARARGLDPHEQRYWDAIRQLIAEEFG